MRNIICIKFNELTNTCICDLEKLKLNIVKINFKKIQKILPFLKQTFTTYYIVLLNFLKICITILYLWTLSVFCSFE